MLVRSRVSQERVPVIPPILLVFFNSTPGQVKSFMSAGSGLWILTQNVTMVRCSLWKKGDSLHHRWQRFERWHHFREQEGCCNERQGAIWSLGLGPRWNEYSCLLEVQVDVDIAGWLVVQFTQMHLGVIYFLSLQVYLSGQWGIHRKLHHESAGADSKPPGRLLKQSCGRLHFPRSKLAVSKHTKASPILIWFDFLDIYP